MANRVYGSLKRGKRYMGYQFTLSCPMKLLDNEDNASRIVQIAQFLAQISGGVVRAQAPLDWIDAFSAVHHDACYALSVFFLNKELIDTLFEQTEGASELLNQTVILSQVVRTEFFLARPKAESSDPDDEIPPSGLAPGKTEK